MQSNLDKIQSQMCPSDIFIKGSILVFVPHMDDAVLGCGGMLARIKDKSRVRLVYCTDGRGSMSDRERSSILNTDRDIGIIRKKETCNALSVLGYSQEQVIFLPYNEWHLSQEKKELKEKLIGFIKEFEPAYIFIPSRYDKHVDHLFLNHESRHAATESGTTASLFEYFVYYQWKLLPSGDIRTYIKPQWIKEIDISAVSSLKREALDCFVSQTTLYYDWQHKPVLSNELLSKFSAGPEMFMAISSGVREKDILTVPHLLIHMLNRLEPFLKNTKEKLLSIKHCKFRAKNVVCSGS